VVQVSPQKSSHYTVKKGDTLRKIANRYGISESALTSANQKLTAKSLRAGKQIVIPAKSAQLTIRQIAARYGISTEDFLRYNPAFHPDAARNLDFSTMNGATIFVPKSQPDKAKPSIPRFEFQEKVLTAKYQKNQEMPRS